MSGRLTRARAAALLLALLALGVAADLAASPPLDPFAAPAPLALWSGKAAAGGYCAAPAR